MNELFAGKQVTMWLTERCEINASDAKLYADALVRSWALTGRRTCR